ncbi:hypothetical protein [Deinococcus arenicola]|uniref:Uncharacterized protein n=1 Tax=Deinococcus arenicola TaxID=2994950 RepID=A0ABU4DUZ5_9DEIO|nr:hypothetical protein [Deinococcus sp. ZS9-10]MDV6376263.1 hypothetical protein [Deinococcus sp. ZS9-10]
MTPDRLEKTLQGHATVIAQRDHQLILKKLLRLRFLRGRSSFKNRQELRCPMDDGNPHGSIEQDLVHLLVQGQALLEVLH